MESFENNSINFYGDHLLGYSNLNNNESRPQSDDSSMPLNSYSPFQSYTSIIYNDNNQNIEDDSNRELIDIENKFKDTENNNKFLLYLKMNNLIRNYNLLEKDRDVNKKKKNFQNKLNETMDNIKCKICAKTPKVFYICKKTKELICQDCLEKEPVENKNFKYCLVCKQLIFSKEHFVELPIFNKIISYIDTIKGNNNKLFDDKIKNNMDKNVILCSEKIHEQNYKKERNDILNSDVKEEYNFYSSNLTKAFYFCIECQRPFCSDCILSYKLKQNGNNYNIENNKNEIIDNEQKKDNIDDNNQNQHSHTHHIFKIDLIKEFGLFDLLYEKDKAKEIMSDLDSIDKKINDKIEDLNLNKQRMISFIDYIKNIYVHKIEEIIDKLKSINEEKSENIKIILENSKKLSNFINNFKSKNDFKKMDNKNSLKEFINVFESFHTIPYDIYKKFNSFINVKGTFNVNELNTFSFNFFLESYVKQKIPLNKKEFLKIIYENKTENNKLLEKKDEEEKKINEEDKIKIRIKRRGKNEYNKKIKEYYSCRILINNNNNELIEMKDTLKKKKMKKIKFNEDDLFQNNNARFISFEKDLNDDEMYEKKYLTELNINSLKKLGDISYNINFEIYDFYIY